MKCPQCQSAVPESADQCFNCGHELRARQQALIRGSMIAGRFEVLAPLGKGGMGMVYKAQDHKLEEIVAIKVLRPDIAHDPDMERRFRTEIRLARKVRHRNVCGIHEYGDDGPLRYIAMEYIEGVDLRRIVVESGGLLPDEAFDTCIHTAEGLQAIHEAGIVHRDLKTANLMRDSQGVVRLMDFGIAKQVGADAIGATATATGLVVGTPEYMSPEQAQAGKIDHRSDIYALGIVAFELFTGRVPFRGETPLATIFKHLQEAPPLEGEGAEALPASVVPVLAKALAKHPDERFSSAAEFAAAITQARDAAGIAPLARGAARARPLAGVAASRAATAVVPESLLTPLTHATVVPPSTVVPPENDRPTVAQRPTVARRFLETSRNEAGRLGTTSWTKPASSMLFWAGVGAIVLLVVVGGIALLRPSPSAPRPEPATTPATLPVSTLPAAAASATAPSPLAAAPVPSGTLLVDAIPWGEVVEVLDASGRAQELNGARYTPLSIALPPGTYTVQVRNPGATDPIAKVVTVRSQAAETVSVVFRRVSAQDYLQKTGF